MVRFLKLLPYLVRAVVLFSLINPTLSVAQGKRPQAAVVPLAVLGNVPQTQQQILFNSFLNTLSLSYDLIAQEQFLKLKN